MLAEIVAVVTTVWTPETLLVASMAGFMVGLLVLAYLIDLPVYASDASPFDAAVAIAVTAIFAGAVFYVGQIAVDANEDLPARLISRFGVWVFYSLAMAAGTGTGLAIRRRLRCRRLRRTAAAEIDEETLPPGAPRV